MLYIQGKVCMLRQRYEKKLFPWSEKYSVWNGKMCQIQKNT